MKFIVFDTETSGLPPRGQYKVALHNINMWPHIVQFSYVIYDTDTKSVEHIYDSIIKVPKGIILDGESEKVHGITNKLSETKGINIEDALVEFNNHLKNVDMIVAHNLDFDLNMLRAEWYRLISNKSIAHKYSNSYSIFCGKLTNIKKICTMKENIQRCNIISVSKKDGKPYVKWPTLSELHNHIFGGRLYNLHNSLVDVAVCLRCLCNIHFGYDILESCSFIKENVHVEEAHVVN